jgi:hypothetical protein
MVSVAGFLFYFIIYFICIYFIYLMHSFGVCGMCLVWMTRQLIYR